MFKNLIPYSLELSAKILGLITTVYVFSSLSIVDFGEYSFLRGFALITSTILIFGLQASSFKFANKTYPFSSEYLMFSLMIMAASIIAFWLFNSFFGVFIFGKFEHDIGFYAYFLVFSNMLLLFFTAFMKGRGSPIIGFAINFVVVFLFLLALISINDETGHLQPILKALVAVHVFAAILVLIFMLSQLSKAHIDYNKLFKLRVEWTEVSFAMWLGGFLPALLLQGLTIVFGIYFSGVPLGEIGIALIIVINMGVFKEVSIALFLPKLIYGCNHLKVFDKKRLSFCIAIGTLPIGVGIILLYSLEDLLLSVFPEKLSNTVFTFVYLLAFGQIFMAIYQPIFRLLSAVGMHKSVLNTSVFLMLVLVFMFYLSAHIYHNYFYTVASAVTVCILAVICSLILLKKKVASMI